MGRRRCHVGVDEGARGNKGLTRKGGYKGANEHIQQEGPGDAEGLFPQIEHNEGKQTAAQQS